MNYNQNLDTTIGVRMRLTPEQALKVKQAYNDALYGDCFEETIGHGGVSVTTAKSKGQLTQMMGCDRITLAGILASNDRIAISQIRRWEKALDISLIEPEKLDKAWSSFREYIGV